MMKSLLHSDSLESSASDVSESRTYESTVSMGSHSLAGVSFTINRISFGRRMGLCRMVLDIGQKLEFLEAGEHLHEKVEANLLSHEIDRIYIEWGLVRIEGLLIDGEQANGSLLIAKGPEDLTREIVEAIKGQCGLSEDERKN